MSLTRTEIAQTRRALGIAEPLPLAQQNALGERWDARSLAQAEAQERNRLHTRIVALKADAVAAIAHERERCARIADQYGAGSLTAKRIAQEIRGQK